MFIFFFCAESQT